MSITGDKTLDESVWWLLQKLKSFAIISDENGSFTLSDKSFSDDKTAPNFEAQKLAIKYLEKQKAITSRINVHPSVSTVVHPRPDRSYTADNYLPYFVITIQQPEFDEIHRKYAEKYQTVEERHKKKAESDVVKIKLKAGTFSFNLKNGNAVLNRVSATFSPKSECFNILSKMVNDANYTVAYQSLLGERDGKSSRRDLSFYIRDIKIALGILPEKKARNKNIIQNLKQHGYCLIV